MEIAQQRIQEWIDNGDESIEIDLINLGLTELPDLPQSLQKLNCNKNKLTSLGNLPPNLEILEWPKNIKYHICGNTCSCKKFQKFYEIKLTKEDYYDKYENILKKILPVPQLARTIFDMMDMPVKRCYELYSN